jgi:hypothetical protein
LELNGVNQETDSNTNGTNTEKSGFNSNTGRNIDKLDSNFPAIFT